MSLLANKDAVRRFYRRVTPVYDVVYPLFAGPQRTRHEYYAGLELDPGDRVLDVGCGTGRSARVLLDRQPRVDGIDLTAEAVRRAAGKPALSSARFVVGDAEHLPYRDATFDAVVAIGVLQHLPDPESALREARRVTVDGGHLRLAVPKTPDGRIRAAVADTVMSTVTPAEVGALCRRAGWRSVETRVVRMAWLARDAVVVDAGAGTG